MLLAGELAKLLFKVWSFLTKVGKIVLFKEHFIVTTAITWPFSKTFLVFPTFFSLVIVVILFYANR